MDDNVKMLSGIAVTMLYKEQTIAKIKQILGATQEPSKSLGNVVATIFREAVAQAQQAGAKMDNKVAMQALMVLVKEVVTIVRGKSDMPKEDASQLSKGLLATSIEALKQLTAVPGQGAGQPPAQPQPGQAMGQPAPQPQGMIGAAMGGM